MYTNHKKLKKIICRYATVYVWCIVFIVRNEEHIVISQKVTKFDDKCTAGWVENH